MHEPNEKDCDSAELDKDTSVLARRGLEIMDLQRIREVYDDQYFKLNKFFLKSTGLWPYETGINRIFCRAFICAILIFMLIPQILGARKTAKVNNLVLFVEYIGKILYTLIILLKYYITILNEEKIRNVYNKIAINWMSLKTPEERCIMIDYAKQGRISTISYTAYMLMGAAPFAFLPFYPIVFDMFYPLNATRERYMVLKGEYFLNQDKYYFTINAYDIFFVYISVIVFISIDTAYTIVIHQTLAIFKIVQHRLQKLTAKACESNEDIEYNLIINAIDLHEKALQFVITIQNSYAIYFLLLISLNILIIGITAVELVATKRIMMDYIRGTMFEIGLTIHLFYVNWPGQQLINHSADLFQFVYHNEWYAISEKGKKLLAFMMLRCLKPCVLSAGGIYEMNFENFSAVVKKTLSYIAVAISAMKND